MLFLLFLLLAVIPKLFNYNGGSGRNPNVVGVRFLAGSDLEDGAAPLLAALRKDRVLEEVMLQKTVITSMS